MVLVVARCYSTLIRRYQSFSFSPSLRRDHCRDYWYIVCTDRAAGIEERSSVSRIVEFGSYVWMNVMI
jgi:hypothetical protein